MNAKQELIFKELLCAYKNNNFDEKLEELFLTSDFTKEELAKLISSLCGVEVAYSNNFKNDLKTAISNYSRNSRVVSKFRNCVDECLGEDGKSNCQRSCPFDAILFNDETCTTYIDEDMCEHCGKCIPACDSGSFIDKVEFMPLFNLLNNNELVFAAVAPSIAGQFGDDASMDKLRTAFKKIGFTDMIEVSFFADMLTLKEAFEFNKLVNTEDDLMITSCCCPMWVGMLKKVYGDLVKHVTPSISPMIASGRIIKQLNPSCKVVFVGPCVAKKAEARDKDLADAIDFVLTFQELNLIFETLNINPNELEPDPYTTYSAKGGRVYARTGGVSLALEDALKKLFPKKASYVKPIQCNGIKECKEVLSKAQNKELKANFIEGMGCVGGCVGGPKALIPKEHGKEKVNEYAFNSPIEVAIDSPYMLEFLHRIGIDCIDDFNDEEKVAIFHRKF